eukprot:TRINITY_DN45563_c0_g1_i1.p1 TRINITY_DN45563_c0_g1~~TRINITY_DN45563_c0_g1_i1.p1  ORF type:complete len:457 (+),score=59.96 TRINITY_DN45563_c0_g1_i1:53-1372(+)
MSVAAGADAAAAAENQKYVYLIYGLVVLYAVCYQLQSPLEPFLVEKLVGQDKGAASTSYGRLQSFFSALQSVGSLCFGQLLDRAGVRIGFVINFLCCAATYYLLATTTSIEMLYLSKVPGIGMAGFLCAQAAVSMLTPSGPERLAALGRLTTCYTIGGVIGPYCGGLLGSKGDYFLSAKVATVGSLLAAAFCCFLPAGRHTKAKDEDQDKPALQTSWRSPVSTVMWLAGFLIFVKLSTNICNSMASSSQSLVLKNTFGFSEADLGFFMSLQFGFGGFANLCLLEPVTRFLGGSVRKVIPRCIGIMALGYALQAAFNSQFMQDAFGSDVSDNTAAPLLKYNFVAIAMMLSIFQYSLGTSITAENTKIVPEDMKGTLIGMEHSIFSAARIATPAIGVSILNSSGVSTLYGVISVGFSSILLSWIILSERALPQEATKTKNG